MNEAQTIKYLKDIYEDTKGYITLASIVGSKFTQRHYKFNKLLNQSLNKTNIFASTNTFYLPVRRIENLKELHLIFVDLDIYRVNLAKSQAYEAVMYYVSDNIIPSPTYIIDSGNGFYLLWKIKPVPYMALPLWKAIEDLFCNRLKELGADSKCTDPTRILRIPKSINGKCNKTVEIYENWGNSYDIGYLKENYLPELKTKVNKGRQNKVTMLYRERSLYQSRIKDLIKLCELRGYHMTGYREFTLFLYRYWLCCFINDADKALNDTLELNNMFTEPLPEREVVTATRSAQTMYFKRESKYKYKNETLIENLCITDREQREMQTIIDKRESKRRHNILNKNYYNANRDIVLENTIKSYYKRLKDNNKNTRLENVEYNEIKVLELLKKGLKQSDICAILDISLRTYINYRQRLKEKNLI